MKILTVQNLCKTYGKGETKVDALKNVSFSLEKGEFAAVVGESGSGKSTLLNCIGALDTPTSGEVQMDGQNLFSMGEEKRTIFRRRNIGFIFQSFQLVSELNVEQNIIFPLLLDYKKPNPAAVQEILELLGLTSRRNHLTNQLSGGHRPGADYKTQIDPGRRAYRESGQQEQPRCHGAADPSVPALPADHSDDYPQPKSDRFRGSCFPGGGRCADGLGRGSG